MNSVVSDIYDAVLNPGLWGVALQRIARFVGGRRDELRFDDLAAGFVLAGHDIGSDLEYMLMHSELYGDFDPFTAVSLLDVEEVLSLLELTPHRDECAHLVYRERRRSNGTATGLMMGARRDPHRRVDVNRNDSDDAVDDDMIGRISLVAPHVRRAILIAKVFGRKLSEAATFSSILDRLRAGLFLIDRDGRIVHANAPGRKILNADEVLQIVNGRLVARDVDVNRTIQDAIARRGNLDFNMNVISLPLTTENLERHVVHVLPQGFGGDSHGGRPGSVASAILVCEARLKGLANEDVIRRAYQLTPTELRVLLALFDVGGISEVSASLGVSKSTVKTHVARLFAKTGASRQADLVKLVAGFMPMFTT
ncbi:LuxR C-terminal-related transcriptional regulator [Bradyrhizobium ontarionense]|uniref:LuxR C-terminal-related transcriptional regulator n=1 Tax=Bradyrhizobium ontarionense TaxID=2898149 RepID=A0ABY3R5F6_9BRAD|nr:LuxR C-terminal-related transcriptional regulator [Bradyrhizobium sp. A19]UFZ02540.1 LuxR C-terminal-related transcriptional regulator [Bradyrhizobium sp. A19]